MSKVLYIACSPATGSTLLPFLLISHAEICSVSHTTGWAYPEDEVYHCSCGEIIEECPFFTRVEKAFDDAGLPFEFRDFHTKYTLAGNSRLDRILTSSLPLNNSSALERLRDFLVWHTPGLRSSLARLDEANKTFINTALAYHGASVFADGSQDPYRLRHLRRLSEFDIRVVHLIRDVRGIALSRRERDGWDAAQATQVWIRDQMSIQRIVEESPHHLRVYYEDVCDSPDEALASMHRLMGLTPKPYSGGFMEGEHHIIGNAMRLRGGSIKKAVRWEKELTRNDLDQIQTTAELFVRRNENHPVADIVRHYLF